MPPAYEREKDSPVIASRFYYKYYVFFISVDCDPLNK